MTDEAFDRGITRWLRDRVAGVAPCAAEYGEDVGVVDLKEMTLGEAEAYRRGFEAAKEKAAEMADVEWRTTEHPRVADAMEWHMHRLRAMEPGE
jgi:hypothetical protein